MATHTRQTNHIPIRAILLIAFMLSAAFSIWLMVNASQSKGGGDNAQPPLPRLPGQKTYKVRKLQGDQVDDYLNGMHKILEDTKNMWSWDPTAPSTSITPENQALYDTLWQRIDSQDITLGELADNLNVIYGSDANGVSYATRAILMMRAKNALLYKFLMSVVE